MASSYWIKLYHEILEDPKMGPLSDRLWRRTIECFLLAGDNHNEGNLPSLQDMAWRLRVNSEILESDLMELANVGILEQTEGNWKVAKFAERQRKRTSAERMQEYRKRDKEKDYKKGWELEEETVM